jgi:DNA-binding transcriptional regulator LsrR (DeoR family)
MRLYGNPVPYFARPNQTMTEFVSEAKVAWTRYHAVRSSSKSELARSMGVPRQSIDGYIKNNPEIGRLLRQMGIIRRDD